MRYEVRIVEDSRLPGGVDYAFVRLAEETYLFVKRSAMSTRAGACRVLTRSFNTWEAAQSVEALVPA